MDWWRGRGRGRGRGGVAGRLGTEDGGAAAPPPSPVHGDSDSRPSEPAGGPAGGSLGGGAEDGDAGGVALDAGAAEEVEAVGHGGEDGVQAGAG